MAVFNGKIRSMKEISFVTIFILSLVFAMIFCMIYKSEFLLQADVLSQASLSLVKTYGSNKGSLFLYVLSERIWIIPVLFLLSTTYLAGPAVYGTIIWYGISLGTVWAVALLRYGMKGIWFLVFSGFPQYLLYIPTLIITFKVCRETRMPERRFFLQFFVLEGMMIVGCFLETYVNFFFLQKIIKLFIGV